MKLHLFLSLTIISAFFLVACQPGRSISPEDPISQVFLDFQAIQEAIDKYQKDHGSLPSGDKWQARSELVLAGYMKNFPTPPPEIFSEESKDYYFHPAYDYIDNDDVADAAIVVWRVKDQVCREYNQRFLELPEGASDYDPMDAGKRMYPTRVFGKNFSTFAIKWKGSGPEDCEIIWVVEYR